MSAPVDTLLVAGAPVVDAEPYRRIIDSASRLIAVDRGADLCMTVGRVPDMLVGDLDSITQGTLATLRCAHVPIVMLDRHKNISDLDAALRVCAEEHVRGPAITAASSGRLDHTLAVVGTMARYAAVAPRLVEPHLEGWIVSSEDAVPSALPRPGIVFSVIPILGPARVSMTGVRYPLDEHLMAPLGSLGLSNVAQTPDACIRVLEGFVLILVPEHAD